MLKVFGTFFSDYCIMILSTNTGPKFGFGAYIYRSVSDFQSISIYIYYTFD